MKEKKNFCSKGKIQYFMKLSEKMFLTDTLAKISQNIFAYISISEHSSSFSLFQKKTPILVTARGFPRPPPPFTDWSVNYRFQGRHTKQFFLVFEPLKERGGRLNLLTQLDNETFISSTEKGAKKQTKQKKHKGNTKTKYFCIFFCFRNFLHLNILIRKKNLKWIIQVLKEKYCEKCQHF